MFGRSHLLVAGTAAPPFVLPAHDGSRFSLTDRRDRRRVVLVFYPQDATPASTAQLRALEAARPHFEALRAQLVAVSPSPSEAQARYARRLGLGFPLLSDPAGQVAGAYGARRWWGLFRHRCYVIDGRGVIGLAGRGLTDVDLLLTYLEGLRGDLAVP